MHDIAGLVEQIRRIQNTRGIGNFYTAAAVIKGIADTNNTVTAIGKRT